jgi:hypothetical protein
LVAKQSSAGDVRLRTVEEGPVDRQLKLFRFLDFTKYVSMLDQRAVFFTRANESAFEAAAEGLYVGAVRYLDYERESALDGSELDPIEDSELGHEPPSRSNSRRGH